MPSDDSGAFESMVTLDQKQLQQHRQDQIETDDRRITKFNSDDEFQKNLRNLKKLNGIRKIEEETIKDEKVRDEKIQEKIKEKIEETIKDKIKDEIEDEKIKEKQEEADETEVKDIQIKERKEENEEIVNPDDYYLDIESYDESTESSDVEEDLEEDVLRDRGWMSEIPSAPPACEIETGNGFPLPTVEAPCFGDVCVKNSNNVHLGSKTFYKGPVTIKQFVYSNSEFKKDEELGYDEKRDSVPSQNASHTSDAPLNPQFIKVKQWLITWKWAAIFCTIALMFVTIIVMIVLTSKHNKAPQRPIFPEIPDSSTSGDPLIHGVKIIYRNDWLAQPPSQPRDALIPPVKYVFISHTATDFCYNQAQCVNRVRIIQTFHIESKGWADIAYNFLVGGDGYIYEGRSWNYVGAHTFNYNNISIGISFIGTFNDYVPPKSQLFAAEKIIEKGVELGIIRKNYTLLGHRQVIKTESPGDALFNVIKTWPHWAPTP